MVFWNELGYQQQQNAIVLKMLTKFCGGGLMPGEIAQEIDKTFTTVLIT